MMSSDMERLAKIRDAAIKERDAAIAQAGVTYAAECALVDKEFDGEFDRVRAEYEHVRGRARPTYDLAKHRQAQALAEAEAKINETIRDLYLAKGIVDSRFPETERQ
jgi:hypothetical protein